MSNCSSPTPWSPEFTDDGSIQFPVLDRLGPEDNNAGPYSSSGRTSTTSTSVGIRTPAQPRSHRCMGTNGPNTDSHSSSAGKADTVLSSIKSVFSRWLENVRAKNSTASGTAQTARHRSSVTASSSSSSLRNPCKPTSHRSSKASLINLSGTPPPSNSPEPRPVPNSSSTAPEAERLALAVTVATAREAEIEAAERRRRQNSSTVHSPTPSSSRLAPLHLNTQRSWNRTQFSGSNTPMSNALCESDGLFHSSSIKSCLSHTQSGTNPSSVNHEAGLLRLSSNSSTHYRNARSIPNHYTTTSGSTSTSVTSNPFDSKPIAMQGHFSPLVIPKSMSDHTGPFIANSCIMGSEFRHSSNSKLDNHYDSSNSGVPHPSDETSLPPQQSDYGRSFNSQYRYSPEPWITQYNHPSLHKCWHLTPNSHLCVPGVVQYRQRNSVGVFSGVSAMLQAAEMANHRICRIQSGQISGLRRTRSVPILNEIVSFCDFANRFSQFDWCPPTELFDPERYFDH
ncbi:unnamed protein product [Echinostoma caproni]|uniref:Rho-GAP domain-containing protein n=1 Tax=Echinostoma caproni TaxID=27848 RepID=A0A183AND3_9TREM|nr:unnamed protein product [Echinostoma caproni]